MIEHQNPSAPWRISLQAWFALFGLGLALWLTVTYLQDILSVGWVLFGAVLLSLAIRPLSDHLARHHIPAGVTVAVVYVAGLGLLVGMGYLLAPIITQEVAYLQTNGPTLLQAALTRLANTPLARWLPSSDALAQNLSQQLDTIVTGAVVTVADTSNILLDLAVVFFVAYFLVAEDGRYSERMVLAWFPPAQRGHIREILDKTQARLSRFVLAQLVIVLFFVVTFSLGLAVLGVPFALTIGVVSGVLSLIPVPYLGTVIAIALTAVSAASGNPWQMVWVGLYTLAVGAFEAHVLLPILYGRAVGLDSAMVLVALLAGAKMGGIVGIFFAVPAAVIGMAVLSEVQAAAAGTNRLEKTA